MKPILRFDFMLRLVCLQWDFMPGVRDDVSHVEVNVK